MPDFPSPPARLITGHLTDFRAGRLEFFTHCARTYGDVVRLRIVHRPVFLISDPHLIEQVLIHQARNFVKHFGLRVFKPVLGNGLVTSEGDFWRRQRKLVAPAFVASRLAGYATAMVEATSRMLDGWPKDGTRDVHEDMMRLTLEVACKTFFSAEEPPDADVVGRALYQGMHALGERFRRIIPIPDWMPTPNNLRLNRSLRTLGGIVHRILQGQDGENPSGEAHDLLSTLLSARDEDGAAMSERQLMDEVMTLLLAGHETTALALSYSLYLLAKNPVSNRALQEELTSVLGDRSPSWEDIARLKFTRRVVNEAMRLYPPADVLGRESISDCTIGHVPVPRGTTVFMSQWVMHRDPRFFPDPLEFRPDRWTEEMERNLPRFAYFPFGGGPRNCVGQGFALAEAVLILAEISRRYRFTPVEDFELVLWPNITLRPREGVRLHVARIE